MATASLPAHVKPSFAAPLAYQVAVNSPFGPASVFHLGRLVPVIGAVASAEYEWDVMTSRYFVEPPSTSAGTYLLMVVPHPTASQQVTYEPPQYPVCQ